MMLTSKDRIVAALPKFIGWTAVIVAGLVITLYFVVVLTQ
jgi:nicotinamide riboside transporter PnuC